MTNVAIRKSLILLTQQPGVINKFRSQNSRTLVTVAKKYVLSEHFTGEPQPTALTLVEEKLPAIKDGEILVEAEYLSVDPYMRAYTAYVPLGNTMIGAQVAKILESKNHSFPVGKKVLAYLGWRTHTVLNPGIPAEKDQMFRARPYILPDFGDLPSSLALGVLGMPGNTAYFGFKEILQPKTGETMVISGAAGAVGSHVGQIAKIHGLKAIGIAGSDKKCKWLVNELGFDHAINYKTENVSAVLKEVAPKRVDTYFDNVGGDISGSVMYQMNFYGRVAVCGTISSLNDDKLPKTTILQPAIVFKQLKVEGFLVNRWTDRWFEGIHQNLAWIREGKLKYKETVTEGFENTFKAFNDMMKGENVGKAVVKL